MLVMQSILGNWDCALGSVLLLFTPLRHHQETQPCVCCEESYSTGMYLTLTSQFITDVMQKAVMPDVSAKKEDGIQPSVFHRHSHCYVTCQYGCGDIRA
jgi:hypothetical protein